MSAVENYRINVVEFDFAGFINQTNNQVGAMVVESSKGVNVPYAVNGEEEIIRIFGTPSSDYSSLFEAIEYARADKLWVVSAYNTDEARYGGVDVRTDSIKGFGARTGRVYETFQGYVGIRSENSFTAGQGDGENGTFTGAITGISETSPIESQSFRIKVGNKTLDVTESGGVLSGASLSSPGTLDLTSGAFSFTLDGIAGTEAVVTTSIDGSSNYDLSGIKNKAIDLIIDGTRYENIDLGVSNTTTIDSVVTAINTAVGSSVAEETDSSGEVGTGFITITGTVKDAVNGNITVLNPSDTVTYDSAVNIVFVATGILQGNGTNPTGAIPRFEQDVILETIVVSDETQNVSHTFFALSPNATVDQAISVRQLEDGNWNLRLFQKRTNGQYALENEFTYSLTKGAKDSFGRSIYINDVFRNQTLIPYINTNFTGVVALPNDGSVEDLTGGIRGGKPRSIDIQNAWKNFENVNKYPVKNFMDVLGDSMSAILQIRNDFQRQAFCIGTVPFGLDRTQAIDYRKGLSISDDQGALYAPWTLIRDTYNDSFAWTSRIGAVGVKYSQTNDFFDSLSPAGVDIAGDGGGQIQSTFRPIETEYDFKNESDLREFNDAQLNPIILDPDYGLSIWGDRTLINLNTDTSFVGTRRVYNLIVDRIKKQVLRQQIFKNNDDFHRLKARTLINEIVEPISDGQYINDYRVICDLTNNTDSVRNSRRFVVTLLIQATPNSQFVELKFVRLPQGIVLDDFQI